tara:strand:- start:373 stop:645 length:273 start_codon:yes stop_codon:yes gene_type:complete
MILQVLQIGAIKARLRQSLEENSGKLMVLVYEDDCVRVHREGHERGIILDLIPGRVMNQDGDYMTEEEIQDVVNILTAVVDEHNSQLSSS